METRRLKLSALTVAVLLAPPALAERCYSGGSDRGRLEFSGAVEDSGFTGHFGRFDVRYCLPAGLPERGRIEVVVATGSADSENRDRDEALLGVEFFHAEVFPEARWTSTAIRANADGYTAEGELTLRGITAAQPIEFRLTANDAGGFSMIGSAEVERLRFDVGTGEFADPDFVRNRVDLRFDLVLDPE